MSSSLEENFFKACKNGDMMLLYLSILQKVNINCRSGYGLRRAIRYNQKVVWRFLLGQSELQINLQNEHGQTALHTAARFNVPEAAVDILRRSDVDTNLRSDLGSSPAMVATKYASKETLSVLSMDPRVRMDVVDKQDRELKDVIGAAIIECDKNLTEEIQLILDFGNMTLVPQSSSETTDEGYFTTSSTGSRVTM